MEWYDFLVGTRRYRHHREKGAMHFHSTTYLSFIQSCSKTERHFCILLSYIRLRWPELSCRLFARSYISKVVYFFPNAMRIKPSQRKGIHHTGLWLSSGPGLLGDFSWFFYFDQGRQSCPVSRDILCLQYFDGICYVINVNHYCWFLRSLRL